MLNLIHEMPITRRALTVAAQTTAIAQRTHQAVTCDRAIRFYNVTWSITKTAILLTIAAALLTVDAGKAFRQWVETHKNKDFAMVATEKFEAVAETVKGVVKAQRDRAALLVHNTAESLETAARLKVAEVCEMVSDRALQSCPGNVSPANLDEV